MWHWCVITNRCSPGKFNNLPDHQGNNRLTCGRVSRLHDEIKGSGAPSSDNFCLRSAPLPDPGGGGDVPPGHVNETDDVTCQCPGPSTAVRGQSGERRRSCSGNVGRAILVAYWLILPSATPTTPTSYPVFKCVFFFYIYISKPEPNVNFISQEKRKHIFSKSLLTLASS